jgi:hypothetical protein
VRRGVMSCMVRSASRLRATPSIQSKSSVVAGRKGVRRMRRAQPALCRRGGRRDEHSRARHWHAATPPDDHRAWRWRPRPRTVPVSSGGS